MNIAVETHAKAIQQARSFTNLVCADFTEAEAFRGSEWNVNHLVWLLGHMSVSQRRLILWFTRGEDIVPAGWGPLFGIGSSPQPREAYPSLAETRVALDEGHVRCMEVVRSFSDADLDRPTEHELAPLPFFKTWGDMLRQCALHESQHCGQILTLRKLLNKPTLA